MRKALVIAIVLGLVIVGGAFATARAEGSCNINWSALSPCNWSLTAMSPCNWHFPTLACNVQATEAPVAESMPRAEEKCSLCKINWSVLSPCNWHWPRSCALCSG